MIINREFGVKRCFEITEYLEKLIQKHEYGIKNSERFKELYMSASGLYNWWYSFVRYLDNNNLTEIEIRGLKL